MDLRTGKTYSTYEDALGDGVPPSDVAHVTVDQRLAQGRPIVQFSKGSFKSVRRTESGELVRVTTDR